MGGPEAFEARWNWSSTQSSGNGAFSQHFYYGGQGINYESAVGRARAVRLIQLSA